MRDFTKGNERKLIFYFAMPMLIGNILQQAYGLVDSIIVGRAVGKDALGAVSTTLPINFFVLALTLGITMGATILVGQYYGAKDTENLRKTIDTAFLFIMGIAVVIAVFGYMFSFKILEFLNVPDNIIHQSDLYLKIAFIGSPVMFGYNIISSMLRGVGDSKRPLYFLVFSTCVNISLDLIFVVGMKMGIMGAAYATLIAQIASFAAGFIYINRKDHVLKIDFSKVRIDGEKVRKILKIGLPASVQYLLVSTGMMVVQSLLNSFGADTMTAFGAAGRIDSLGTMPAITFSSALSGFAAQNFGAGKFDRVKRGYRETILMSSAVVLAIVICVQFFSKGIMSMFVSEKEVIELGVQYLKISSMFYIFPTVQFISYALFRGAGDSTIPMIISVTALWGVRLPIAYFLVERIGSGSIYWSNCAAWVMGFVLAYGYYAFGPWKKKAEAKIAI